MDTIYQRPREKLRSSGANSLSEVELIQVLLGSGSQTSTVGKIARDVCALIAKGPISYGDLIAITGVGDAKACQILAAAELSKRL